MVYVKPFIFSFHGQLSVAFFSPVCSPAQKERSKRTCFFEKKHSLDATKQGNNGSPHEETVKATINN